MAELGHRRGQLQPGPRGSKCELAQGAPSSRVSAAGSPEHSTQLGWEPLPSKWDRVEDQHAHCPTQGSSGWQLSPGSRELKAPCSEQSIGMWTLEPQRSRLLVGGSHVNQCKRGLHGEQRPNSGWWRGLCCPVSPGLPFQYLSVCSLAFTKALNSFPEDINRLRACLVLCLSLSSMKPEGVCCLPRSRDD